MTARFEILRRRSLLLAGLTALPFAARAQGATPSPGEPTPPSPPSSPAIPGGAAPAAAASSHPPSAIDRTKTYYLFFDQNIDIASMKALRKQLSQLVDAGVTDITLVISSNGGLVASALVAYSFIRSLPARVDTHAQGIVASAAVVLFMAGQHRSADLGARFLFHPSQFSLAANLNEQQMHDQLALMTTVDEEMAEIYRERTKLTAEAIASFQQSTVIFNAEQALERDIVQTVGDLRIPGDQKAKILFIE